MEQRLEEAGKRDDKGKLRWDLVPAAAMKEIVQVLTYGASKYGDSNWRGGMSWSRHFAAMMRHSWSWVTGESYDKESGLHHLAHAAVSAMFLFEYEKCGVGKDDRFKYSTVQPDKPMPHVWKDGTYGQ